MDDLAQIARRQIEIAIAKQQLLTEDAITVVQAEASRRGMLKSSSHLLMIDRACADAIQERAIIVWEIIHRCISSAAVEFSPKLAAELKELALPYFEGAVGGLTTKANETAEKLGLRGGDFLRQAKGAREHARAWMETEIDLFTTVLAKTSPKPHYSPHSIINIMGSQVGSVQTGNNSTTMVTQSTRNPAFADTLAAVRALRTELVAAGTDSPDILDLVDSSEAELEKSKPNRSKVSAFFTALTSCLSSVVNTSPKIPAALEGVKKAWEICT
jgi:hypothetical protein